MQDINVERWQSKVHSRREGASPQIIFKTEIFRPHNLHVDIFYAAIYRVTQLLPLFAKP